MSAERLKGAKAQLAGVGPREKVKKEGWEGWDEYAPFYDWENAQTLGTRDVSFWLRVAAEVRGRVLELGCGTGRLSLPLARSGASVVGVDRSERMLARAASRADRLRRRRGVRRPIDLALVRGDIRTLPFDSRQFAMVLAPYGVLQSLLRERDLTATLEAVARVLAPGGLFGVDLVPDVPKWREYRNRVQLRGRSGRRQLTLVESVRQDRGRRLTIFEQCWVERSSGARSSKDVLEHRFELVFRTLTMRGMIKRIERAGFDIEHVLGDYRGRPWEPAADTWLILARR